MTTFAEQHNIGSYIKTDHALIPAVITAGAGNDGVEVSGPYRTRDLTKLYHSMKISIAWSTTLGSNATLTLVANIQDADDVNGTGVADFGTVLASAVVATGASGAGSTVRGVTEFNVDIGGMRQFWRLQCTATLSASGTDTVAIAAVAIYGGADVIPAA